MTFYVYALFHPGTGGVFYIGKGKAARRRTTISNNGTNTPKNRLVLKLRKAGLTPIVIELSNGLKESEAFDLERAFIRAIGRIPASSNPPAWSEVTAS